MTKSLGGKLPGDGIQEFNLYTKDHRCKSISRYIKFPFGSQDIDASNILEVSLWQY